MLLVNAVKTICDFLLCFSFAALIASYSESWLLMGSVLLLAFLSSLILQKTNGSLPAKLFCGLLPALGLFAARSFAEMEITAVILAFYLVLTLSGRNQIHYEEYKYWFGFPAVPAVIVFVVCLGKWPIRPAAAVCAAAYLFLGVLVLRRKRMGAGASLKLRGINLAELTAVVGFAVLASLLLYAGMRHSSRIIEAILLPFGLLLNAVVFLLDRFIRLFKRLLPDEPLIPEETDIPVLEGFTSAETLPTDPRDETVFAQVETLVHVIAILLALAFLVWLLYRFYKMIRSARTESTGAAASIEGGQGESLLFRRNRRKQKRLPIPSNNEKIRTVYRDYLSCLKLCGVEIACQTTSEEVLGASGRLTAHGEAEQLRALYIRARYHDSEEISNAEVREAEMLLARIKEQIEAGKAAKSSPVGIA